MDYFNSAGQSGQSGLTALPSRPTNNTVRNRVARDGARLGLLRHVALKVAHAIRQPERGVRAGQESDRPSGREPLLERMDCGFGHLKVLQK